MASRESDGEFMRMSVMHLCDVPLPYKTVKTLEYTPYNKMEQYGTPMMPCYQSLSALKTFINIYFLVNHMLFRYLPDDLNGKFRMT